MTVHPCPHCGLLQLYPVEGQCRDVAACEARRARGAAEVMRRIQTVEDLYRQMPTRVRRM